MTVNGVGVVRRGVKWWEGWRAGGQEVGSHAVTAQQQRSSQQAMKGTGWFACNRHNREWCRGRDLVRHPRKGVLCCVAHFMATAHTSVTDDTGGSMCERGPAKAMPTSYCQPTTLAR